jgi:hypothetical protein
VCESVCCMGFKGRTAYEVDVGGGSKGAGASGL